VNRSIERCAMLDVHKTVVTACVRVPDGAGGRAALLVNAAVGGQSSRLLCACGCGAMKMSPAPRSGLGRNLATPRIRGRSGGDFEASGGAGDAGGEGEGVEQAGGDEAGGAAVEIEDRSGGLSAGDALFVA
jgi:hypothetical protein